eukprot:CAMPEP_0172672660 /NCGR_PEP_ID=MMETSP1074-20121228/11682_1 /TAXON_ID=2916 /ORGANISM="Ceratium fusus, Strain PA161109" /LENGTH=48 /DNA_ID= /DNA_START= /DNA_END= /DNA_ORIENTATION=
MSEKTASKLIKEAILPSGSRYGSTWCTGQSGTKDLEAGPLGTVQPALV